MPPIIGNLLIILSRGDWLLSRIGCYVYYIGLDFTIVSLIRFTANYCSIKWEGTKWRLVMLGILGVDVIQLLLNIVFGHAFTTTEIMVDGAAYQALVPLWGQTFHRIAVYGAFFVAVGIFVYKSVKAPRIYLERYIVILLVMIIAGVWETYYIVSGAPIDRSMIGFGVFGILTFFVTLYYKPVLLLNQMLARVVTNMNDAVFFFDRDGDCIYANDAGSTLLSADQSGNDLQSYKQRLEKMIGDKSLAPHENWTCKQSMKIAEFANLKNGGDSPEQLDRYTVPNPQADSDTLYFTLSLQSLEDKNGKEVGSFLTVRDVTEEERKINLERYNTIHDPLTGLYNATHLYKLAEQMMRDNPETTYCIVGIDIREFKLINDIFSKEFGDLVLQSLAENMRKYAAPDEVYGRISGDRFGFVLPAHEIDDDLVEKRLNEEGFAEYGVNYPIVVHMGIYETCGEDLPLSVMFDRAFMAINSIKNDFRHHVARYDNAMRDEAIWNQKISGELDNAIATGQVRPYLQPLVDETGKVQGAEVLVRWIHPEEGFLSPARFIPFFEENGRVAQLDAYIWECACRILKKWGEAGIDLFLSVNISPKDFYFMDVQETIGDLVRRYGINPAKLRLEITETVMMSDVENRLRIVEGLRAAGFYVEMDDFGSGYSSLNMLKDIPVDILKIDMMFLYKTKDQQRAQTILQTIIHLSEQLGMPSITEGVETSEQLAMLTSMGCRLFQGYYFAKPMPLNEFESAYCQAA